METIILQFDQNPNIAKDSLVPIMTTDRRLIPLNGSKLGHSFSSTSIINCCSIDVPLIKVKINRSFCTKNGNGGYAWSPVLRNAFHLSFFN